LDGLQINKCLYKDEPCLKNIDVFDVRNDGTMSHTCIDIYRQQKETINSLYAPQISDFKTA